MSQSTEQRVVASKPKIGARPTSPTVAPQPAEPEGRKKSGIGKVLLVIAAMALAGGGVYWFTAGPGAGGAETAQTAVEPAPEPGEVLAVDPISLNLAGGRYLRIGIALQLTADVHEEPDTARALDAVVALFSQRPIEEVTTTEGREALKGELLHQLEQIYEGEVMDVYFTDYVTQ